MRILHRTHYYYYLIHCCNPRQGWWSRTSVFRSGISLHTSCWSGDGGKSRRESCPSALLVGSRLCCPLWRPGCWTRRAFALIHAPGSCFLVPCIIQSILPKQTFIELLLLSECAAPNLNVLLFWVQYFVCAWAGGTYWFLVWCFCLTCGLWQLLCAEIGALQSLCRCRPPRREFP